MGSRFATPTLSRTSAAGIVLALLLVMATLASCAPSTATNGRFVGQMEHVVVIDAVTDVDTSYVRLRGTVFEHVDLTFTPPVRSIDFAGLIVQCESGTNQFQVRIRIVNPTTRTYGTYSYAVYPRNPSSVTFRFDAEPAVSTEWPANMRELVVPAAQKEAFLQRAVRARQLIVRTPGQRIDAVFPITSEFQSYLNKLPCLPESLRGSGS